MILLLLTGLLSPAYSGKPELSSNEVLLVLNAPDADLNGHVKPSDPSLPRNWRASDQPYLEERVARSEKRPTRKGLDHLHAFASGQFSKLQFQNFLRKFPSHRLIVVDLRQEPHGFINNNWAISWYSKENSLNSGKSPKEIENEERNKLRNLLDEKSVSLSKWKSSSENDWKLVKIPTILHSVSTEKDLILEAGHDYVRIPVPDFQRPGDLQVDQFIQLIRHLTSDKWLYFHCSAGEGRTTTFLTLYDMMRNFEKLSADEIIERQYALGGADLAHPHKKSSEKNRWAEVRFEFLKKFYRYCKENGPEFKQSWSEWLRRQ